MTTIQREAQLLDINLDARQLTNFENYYRLLIEANKRTNLTTITDYQHVQTRHFFNSLICASVLTPPMISNSKIMDVGTGAGFPGLPIKIAFPDLQLTLLEATAKKTQFLSHVVKALDLNRVRVITGRAEEVAHNPVERGKYDFVMARAVAKLPILAELCLPFCAVGGLVLAYKGQKVEEEITGSEHAIKVLGGRLRETIQVGKGNLLILEKLQESPPQYPRRSGIPAKRPL